MLGAIHRSVHGFAHPDMCQLFVRKPAVQRLTRSAAAAELHGLQLVDHCREYLGYAHALLKRSVFGLVGIWNALPASVVNYRDVGTFQTALTHMARDAALAEAELVRRGLEAPGVWMNLEMLCSI